MDFLIHNTTSTAFYNILKEGKFKTPIKLGINGTTDEDKNAIYFTPITKEILNSILSEKSSTNFYIVLNATILNKYDTYFINSNNAFGPLTGHKLSKSCKCSYTYYSDLLKKRITPKSYDCYVNTLSDMINKLINILPQNTNIFNHCDGGPEVGIYPPDGEIDFFPYLSHIIYPNKTQLSKYSYNSINKSIGIDVFYNLLDNIHVNRNYTGGKYTKHSRHSKYTKRSRHSKYTKSSRHSRHSRHSKYTKRSRHYKKV